MSRTECRTSDRCLKAASTVEPRCKRAHALEVLAQLAAIERRRSERSPTVRRARLVADVIGMGLGWGEGNIPTAAGCVGADQGAAGGRRAGRTETPVEVEPHRRGRFFALSRASTGFSADRRRVERRRAKRRCPSGEAPDRATAPLSKCGASTKENRGCALALTAPKNSPVGAPEQHYKSFIQACRTIDAERAFPERR
jgi:hypothetical protein